MVRRRLILSAVTLGLLVTAWVGACTRNQDMPEHLEMPDSMEIMKAMDDEVMRDSMLDMMPGGEMAHGDSAAAMELLKRKGGR